MHVIKDIFTDHKSRLPISYGISIDVYTFQSLDHLQQLSLDKLKYRKFGSPLSESHGHPVEYSLIIRRSLLFFTSLYIYILLNHFKIYISIIAVSINKFIP